MKISMILMTTGIQIDNKLASPQVYKEVKLTQALHRVATMM